MVSARKRGVEIFSFSFVDILATTIGVLLFILLIAVLNQSGMAKYADVVRRIEEAKAVRGRTERELENAKQELAQAEEDTRQALENSESSALADMAKEARRLASENEATGQENEQLRQQCRQLEDRRDALDKQRRAMRTRAAASGKKYMLPDAKEGSGEAVVHVDCRADGLTIMGTGLSDDKLKWRFCPKEQVKEDKGAFAELLNDLKKQHFDRVELKSGAVIEGEIARESDQSIAIKVPTKSGRGRRIASFRMSAVKRISR